MYGSIGAFLAKLLFVIIGLILLFIYPRMIKKKVDKMEDTETGEKELRKARLISYVGMGLMFAGIFEIFFS